MPDKYFDDLYATAEDPWELTARWYERRKYAITLALLPKLRYQAAFEPGCSVGTLTELLAGRCSKITAVDVAQRALDSADQRLRDAGCRDRVTLLRRSLDDEWPSGPFDLVVLSEVAYYLNPMTLSAVLSREVACLQIGATVVSAHWRHSVADYPMSGDHANEIICGTPGLNRIGCYRDEDVVIDVLAVGDSRSVATHERLPGAPTGHG